VFIARPDRRFRAPPRQICTKCSLPFAPPEPPPVHGWLQAKRLRHVRDAFRSLDEPFADHFFRAGSVAPGTASAFSQGPFDGERRSKEAIIGSVKVFVILILFMLTIIPLIFHFAGALVQGGFIAAKKLRSKSSRIFLQACCP
jgi:hypothetical protein